MNPINGSQGTSWRSRAVEVVLAGGVLSLALLRPVALVAVPVVGQAIPAVAVPLVVDNFEGPEAKNTLGNRDSTFVKAPSKVMVGIRDDAVIAGQPTHVLMVRYDKKQTGGPSDTGGWAGYYTLLKSSGAAGEQYLDASGHKALTFQVRGETGAENFVIGVSDRHWDQVGDSVKSQEIGKYLPAGKLTTTWQKATIPFDEFFVDYTRLSGISVLFDGDLFPVAGSAGKIYLDDITLE